MSGSVGEFDGGIENAPSHEALATIDLEREVVPGVVGGDGVGREDGEAAGGIASAGVDGVWQVEAGILEAGLKVFEVFGSADFADAEDVGLFADNDFDEGFDFFRVL